MAVAQQLLKFLEGWEMPTSARTVAMPKRNEGGVAALELALLLPVFVILLSFALFFGRLFWHYSVIQRAAQDSARYLSTIPLSEIESPARAPAAAAVAAAIVNAEIAELAPGPDHIYVTVSCDSIQCTGFSRPNKVGVAIQIRVSDFFFANVTSLAIPLTASVSYAFDGR
jgi:Flp pilus assembly protein TadG